MLCIVAVSAQTTIIARQKQQTTAVKPKPKAKPTRVNPKPTSGYENGHKWVDLGLSVKWATCNVGATSPEGYGSYYAWGETSTKSSYTWSNLKYCLDNSGDKFSKYLGQSKYGTVDNKTTLDLSDDAAHVNWGGSWRMPTKAEQDELREKCTWTRTTMNGKNGYKVTSKLNGNSIFLPAAGCRYNSGLDNDGSNGSYWSSSLDPSYSDGAYCLSFDSGEVDWRSYRRRNGQSVRAVCQ